MVNCLRTGYAAALMAGSLIMGAQGASAMPAAHEDVVAPASGIEKVVRVCDAWGRCWWRPGPYGRRFYGPRYGAWGHPGWHRGWGHPGWHRGWRRW